MNYHIIIVTFAAIALDFVTGIVKGAATEGIKSQRMREGLFHKVGSILCIILGILLEYAQGVVDLGLPLVPTAGMICGYIIGMEAASVAENICILNPDIAPEKLKTLLGLNKKEED